jgi:hypothetical protein
MDIKLKTLLNNCLPKLAPIIIQEVKRPIIDFKDESYPRLSAIDSNIPGIGMQYAVWSRTTPHYPFVKEFDGIVRPLRYIPYGLASNMGKDMLTRWMDSISFRRTC